METPDISSVFKSVPVVLPIDHWAALKQQSKETGRSASSIVRELVAAHLKRGQRKAAPPQSNPSP